MSDRHEGAGDESSINRRGILKAIGTSGLAAGALSGSVSAFSMSDTSESSEIDIVTLTGDRRAEAISRAYRNERVEAFAAEFSERGWSPVREQFKAYRVANTGIDEQYTVVTATFSTGQSNDAYITWNSLDEVQTYAQKVSNRKGDQWEVTTFQYDTGTETVSDDAQLVDGTQVVSRATGEDVSTQHHGVCGVGKKVNLTCLGKNAGVILGVTGACGTCLSTGNPLSSACQACVSALLGSKEALDNIDCSICVDAE